jgi:hypothetical protein
MRMCVVTKDLDGHTRRRAILQVRFTPLIVSHQPEP